MHHNHNHECRTFHLNFSNSHPYMSAATTTTKQDSHTEQNLKTVYESGTNAMCTDDLNEPFQCDILDNSMLSNQYHTDLVTDEVQINAASFKNPDNIFIYLQMG